MKNPRKGQGVVGYGMPLTEDETADDCIRHHLASLATLESAEQGAATTQEETKSAEEKKDKKKRTSVAAASTSTSTSSAAERRVSAAAARGDVMDASASSRDNDVITDILTNRSRLETQERKASLTTAATNGDFDDEEIAAAAQFLRRFQAGLTNKSALPEGRPLTGGPGAYASLPTVRRPLAVEPGAYALGSPPEILPTRTTPAASTHRSEREPQNNMDLSLAEAHPVCEQDEAVLAHASPVDLEGDTTNLQVWRRYFICAIGFVCVAIIVGSVMGTRQQTSPVLMAATTAPTAYLPSMVPSTSPTQQLGSLFVDLPTSTQTNIQKGSTPQYHAWEWLSHHQNITNLPQWRKQQLFALATFFYAFEGESWYPLIRQRWMDDRVDECFWFSAGLGFFDENGEYIEWSMEEHNFAPVDPCDQSGRFVSLDLQYLQLSGLTPSLPAEIALLTSLSSFGVYESNLEMDIQDLLPYEFFEMTSLENLWLFYNNVTGSIPSEFGLMSNLEVFGLHGNSMLGVIPSELGLMSNLSRLEVYGNALSGFLPSQLGLLTAMTELSLSDNTFSGSIPTNFGLATTMGRLYLWGNKLSGVIPSELGLMSNLSRLEVHGNALSGFLPSQLGLLTAMTELSLSDNTFSGSIPTNFGLATTMGRLYLWGNKLSGTIPSELGLMTAMKEFILFQNSLDGPIPSELGLLTKMTMLALSSNALSGSIPTELGLVTTMEYLYPWGNNLSGPIPSELGMMTAIDHFSLRQNSFSGAIPSELGLMSSATAFVVRENSLSSSIPSELFGAMRNLTILHLSDNDFTGTLPVEIFQLSQLQELDLSNVPLLTGLLFPEVTTLKTESLGVLNVSGSPGLSGSIPEEICFLRDDSCTLDDTSCSLGFDCSGVLCGCDCPCPGG